MDLFNFFEIKRLNWKSHGQPFSFTSTFIICQYQKNKYQHVLSKFLHTANHWSFHLKIKKRFRKQLPLNYELVTKIKLKKKKSFMSKLAPRAYKVKFPCRTPTKSLSNRKILRRTFRKIFCETQKSPRKIPKNPASVCMHFKVK